MKNTHFFHHTLAEYALFNGWDIEADLLEFVKNNERLSTADYATTKTGASLSFMDVAALAKGEINANAKLFFATILEEYPELDSQPDETLMMTSMHSGSSDYLFLGSVREIANYELPNAE